MEFDEQVLLASTRKIGSTSFEVPAGKTLKVETSPNGDDILELTVPESKKFVVDLWIKIQEVDV
uniref:Uncharacterized protein n=1 Tax=viral metagenome TaxID=1070528 RepID=A0A6M3K7V9_9ZZZZ